ncbi:MAG TPA: hypothetical protein VK928_06680 [Longimicrobiales bacterium]|nr:hypothetical protein [Longimicrobiales bacterium]
MITMERQLRELKEFDARGASVLTVYLPTDPLRHAREDVERMLDRLASSLAEGLGQASADALRDDLNEVRDYLGSMIAPPGGIAVFTCTPRHFFRVVRLPSEVGPAAFWAPWAHVAMLVDVAMHAPA